MSALILIANSSEAALYTIDNLNTMVDPRLIQPLTHPESRMREQDLVSDKPGHYQTDHSARSSYERPTRPHDVESERFAIELLTAAQDLCKTTEYEKFICVIPPHFSGLFKKHVASHHLPEIIFVAKDYTGMNPMDMMNLLKAQL